MEVMVIPMVSGALGTIPKELINGTKRFRKSEDK